MSFSAALGGLLALVAPRRCPACDIVVDENAASWFCGACDLLIERATGALGTHAGYVYGGPLAEALRRYKYGARTELATPLGDLLAAEACARFAGRVDVVVPVPLHPRRLRARGFDPAALLARRASDALGVRYVPRAIARMRDTPPQASLDRGDRARNVADAFRVRASLDDLRVLVIDDVRTTGATMFEMAQAVDDAGAASVALLALAAADPDDARTPSR